MSKMKDLQNDLRVHLFNSNKQKGIIIGIGILLFNLGVPWIIGIAMEMMIGLNNGFNGLNGLSILLLLISPFLIIAIFIQSYYFTGKYCGIHWPEPPRKWAIWLAIPWVFIIVISVGVFILMFMGILNGGRGGFGFGLFFLVIFPIIAFVASIVAFSASYKGANDGYKIAYRVPPLGEKREILDKQVRAEAEITDYLAPPIGEKRELPGIFTGISVPEFLKPDLRKIILTLMLISPLVLLLLFPQFNLLYNLLIIPFSIVSIPFWILIYFFGGGGEGREFWVSKNIAMAISLLVEFLIWYFIACLIVRVGKLIKR